jgi:hypothetical protein
VQYNHEVGRKFWFEFDHATKYSNAFMGVVQRGGGFTIQTVFMDTRRTGNYPDKYLASVSRHRADWVTMADAQTKAFHDFLENDPAAIQAAFEDFGQGVLLDTDPERQAKNDAIHTMDIQGTGPPQGYHRWHASIRALQLLNVGDPAWWETIDRFLGLAWGIQSFAKPKQQLVANPPIAQADLDALRTAWLPLTPEQRDKQYDLTGDVGYHPSPKNPVA